MDESISSIFIVGVCIGIGLSFIPMIIGMAVGGILKILNIIK